MQNDKKKYIMVGIVCALVSFILLYIGIKFGTRSPIEMSNILAYSIFSLIVGVVISLLGILKLKAALFTFIFCLILGFVNMYRAFISDMTGWGDLIGVISLIMWLIIGLVSGLFFQLSYYMVKKNKK